MKVAVGSDHRGLALKDEVVRLVADMGHEVQDCGAYDTRSVDYPDIAQKVGQNVASGKFERGILICSTGIGMSIAANKVPGAYAALVSDAYSAERARKSNNANIMTMGAFTTGVEHAKVLVRIWMESEYTPGGKSEPKVQRIVAYDRERR
jgi:ribose 5-phosphate isomerase B